MANFGKVEAFCFDCNNCQCGERQDPSKRLEAIEADWSQVLCCVRVVGICLGAYDCECVTKKPWDKKCSLKYNFGK